MENDGLAVPASWYDGISAIRHEGSARWQRGELVLETVDGAITSVGRYSLRSGAIGHRIGVYSVLQ